MNRFEPYSWRGVLDTTLYAKVCQLLATGRWFSQGTTGSSTNITEILVKRALGTINLKPLMNRCSWNVVTSKLKIESFILSLIEDQVGRGVNIQITSIQNRGNSTQIVKKGTLKINHLCDQYMKYQLEGTR